MLGNDYGSLLMWDASVLAFRSPVDAKVFLPSLWIRQIMSHEMPHATRNIPINWPTEPRTFRHVTAADFLANFFLALVR